MAKAAAIALVGALLGTAILAGGSAVAETMADGLAAFDGGDYPEAVRIWRSLADGGDDLALVALAGLYRTGTGVGQDIAAAARLYRAAANRGNTDAQLNLGELLGGEFGIARDPVAAYMWLSLAAAQGRDWADRRRHRIARDMSRAEIAEADRRAAMFQPISEAD